MYILEKSARRETLRLEEYRTLLTQLAPTATSVTLYNHAILVAKAEAALRVLRLMDEMVARGDPRPVMRDRVIRALVECSDDTWEGLSSDRQRAVFDGVHIAVRDCLAYLNAS